MRGRIVAAGWYSSTLPSIYVVVTSKESIDDLADMKGAELVFHEQNCPESVAQNLLNDADLWRRKCHWLENELSELKKKMNENEAKALEVDASVNLIPFYKEED
jgi:hypothetical protein